MLFLSVTEGVVKGIVVIYPVVYVDDTEFAAVVANNDGIDAGVDYHALAHAAAASVFDIVTGGTFFSHKIKGGAYHVFSCGADDCVCFGMNAAAKFISFAPGNVEFFSSAPAKVAAVLSAAGCTGITGGDYLVVFYDYCTVFPAKAGSAFKNSFGDVEVIIVFVSSFFCHGITP